MSRRVKRMMDIAVAAAGLLVLAPVMLAIAILVRVTMGSPVLFQQVRPGLGARPFELVKFRTMHQAYDEHGRPLDDSARISKIGRLLRRASLDELPELWNILRGHMSLVGPRPLLLEYLATYTPEQAKRNDMRPGLTGWAQIHGRRLVPMPERIALDVWYVDHWSLGLDLRILAATATLVFRGHGVEPPD